MNDLKLTDKHKQVLRDLLNAQVGGPGGVDSLRFEIDHQDDLAELQHLKWWGLIEGRDEAYKLRLRGLVVLAEFDATAEEQLSQCSRIFEVLRNRFIESPKAPILVVDVSAAADIQRADVARALMYMFDAPIWGGNSVDLLRDDSYVMMGRGVIAHKKFDSVLDLIMSWGNNSAAEQPMALVLTHVDGELGDGVAESVSSEPPYVDRVRLDELRGAIGKWDLSRLSRLCEELNVAFQNGCFMTVAMLMRSILDHVPPAFNCSKFSEVSNHYAGGGSFRRAMQKFEGSLRHIADGYLHMQLRVTEALPTQTQVDFRVELDVLLQEVIRLQRESGK